jgi:hypothetical protein
VTDLDTSWYVLLAAGAAFVASLFYVARKTPRRCYSCFTTDPDLLYLSWSGHHVYLCPTCRRLRGTGGGGT